MVKSTFQAKKRVLLYYWIIAVSVIQLFSCVQVKEPLPYQIKDGHQHMIAILDSIATHANPMNCYNLNRRYVAIIEQELSRTPTEGQTYARMRYAEQLINAGYPDRAIRELSDLLQAPGTHINQNTKETYELLALAYLRLGEVNNCINHHTGTSCIIPIQSSGLYQQKSSVLVAIHLYEKLLDSFPDDAQNRWLLNIANMNIGLYPKGVPRRWRIPETVFSKQGQVMHFENIAPQVGLDHEGISGGVCLEDFDNDGDLDVFLSSYGLNDQCRLYINEHMHFRDITTQANLLGIVSGLNTLHADYDNDGDADILILRGGWLQGGTHPNSLLRNNGDLTFTDVTIEAGLLSFHPTQAAAWADYDGDGLLDLYIANESRQGSGFHPNECYHNNGDGTFNNVAAAIGLDLVGFFKAAVWGDINNDQRPDLYLSNMDGNNRLLVNRGGSSTQTWRFEDITQRAGVSNPQHSFPAFFMDYNQDGLDDIFVIGFDLDPKRRVAGEVLSDLQGATIAGDWMRVYRNNGKESFTDVHQTLGLDKITYAMGNNIGDFDNDGWPDFYLGTGTPDLRALIPNRMFWNQGEQKFKEASMNGVAHLQKGHGIATGDVDQDGDTDIFAVMGGAYEGDIAKSALFENKSTGGNKWLQIRLEGRRSNRSAIGARVKVELELPNGRVRTVWSTCNTGGSFGSGSLCMEIGLGNARKLNKLTVYWPRPGSNPSIFRNLAMNSQHTIIEP